MTKKIMFLGAMILLSCVYAPTAANATIFITNLSDSPQRFAVRGIGNNERIVTINPNQRWRTSDVEIEVKPLDGTERTYRPRLYDHYTYWQDGTFGLQMRRRDRAGGSF